MEKRFFTVDQAKRLLPEVKRLAALMVRAHGRLEAGRDAVQKLAEKRSSNSGGPEGAAFLDDLIALQSCVAQLEDLGCQVKGAGEGLVDFPHLKDGREVCLCWRLGEHDILYWHEIDGGFAGRRPLAD